MCAQHCIVKINVIDCNRLLFQVRLRRQNLREKIPNKMKSSRLFDPKSCCVCQQLLNDWSKDSTSNRYQGECGYVWIVVSHIEGVEWIRSSSTAFHFKFHRRETAMQLHNTNQVTDAVHLSRRFVDLFVVSTHNITEATSTQITYHHSRLMGLSDIFNTVI